MTGYVDEPREVAKRLLSAARAYAATRSRLEDKIAAWDFFLATMGDDLEALRGALITTARVERNWLRAQLNTERDAEPE